MTGGVSWEPSERFSRALGYAVDKHARQARKGTETPYIGPDRGRLLGPFESPKPPWEQRKRAYIAAMAGKRADEPRVSLADKVHNARSILRRAPGPLADELRRVVDDLTAAAGR